MWGMEDHGGLDLTETETETDLTPAGYKATTGYPSHPDAQQEAALRLAMEGAKPANAAVLLSNFSLHAPKQPTAQTRNADIPVPSGNLKRGFASDERRGI